jgi:hypothetical protein
MREIICHSLSMVLDTYILSKTTSPPIFTPADRPLEWVRRRPFGTTTFSRTRKNKSRAQAPHRINSGGVQKNAKTNPSSKGRGCFHPYNRHKNVGFQRQHIFPIFQRGPLRKRWKERKWEESTTLVTNQHNNLSPSPPSNSHKQRVQSIQKSPDVGRWVEWEGKRRGE